MVTLMDGLELTAAGNFRELNKTTDKFTKAQAYYVDNAANAAFNCRGCMHYREGKCNLVSEVGDPGPGRINPDGNCSLYNARPPRIKAIQLLWGRGPFGGVTRGTARATAFMFTYAALDEEPPEDLLEKAIWTPEQISERFPDIAE
jgi:hypothetical protein